MTKQEEIIEFIKNNPDCTTTECQQAIGCSLSYTRTVFHRYFGNRKRKYIEGDYIGENGVYFKKRLKDGNGIFICPYDGKEFVGNISGVGTGLIKSCGCLRAKTSREQTFIDLTGQRFGKLVVQYCLPYSTKENRAIWHCKCDCGGEKDVIGRFLRNGHTHSCGCSNSKGEALLAQIFNNISVNFEIQKRFDGFIGSSGKSYQYDFYLPDYNCCIEYDGMQHYCGWRKDSQSLLDIQRRDKVKNDFCLTHDISLVRIPYYCYDNITEESIRDLVKEIANGRLPQIYTYRENQ